MIAKDQLQSLLGGTAVDRDGKRIGTIGQIFLDDETGQAEWATVNTGLFGGKETFVPLANATAEANGVRVPFDKDKVKGAPNVTVDDGHLSQAEEAELYGYYGMGYSEARSDSGLPETGVAQADTTRTVGAVGHDTSGRNTDDAMTRSEERLRVGTERVQTGRARLRKWIETEHVQVTVPIRTEKARLVTEPITDGNVGDALDGPDLSSEEHEVILTTERPIVTKETVPVERVRLTKQVEQVEEQVSETVRKERIAAEGDVNNLTDVTTVEQKDRSGR